MKRLLVAIGPSALAVMCLCNACMSNGALFEELPVPVPEPEGEPATSERPAPAPASPQPEAPPDGPGELSGGPLPLTGEVMIPVAPAAPPAEPAPEPEPEGPSILEVSPADGASGVASDAPLVIRFSHPMDREATEAAYQSESIPSSTVSFLWNEDDTELTIVPPQPLEYSSGSDPEAVEARRLSYFISASAADAEGRPLSRPYEFSFTLLRLIALRSFALQDRELSGNYRSDDAYGGGLCARGQINACVGDVRVAGESEQSRGFISFDLSALGELPESARELSAVLSLEVATVAGDPFAGLGGLILERAGFDAIGPDAFEAEPLDDLGPLALDGVEGDVLSLEVAPAVQAALREGALVQFRLRFEQDTDDDNTSDAVVSPWDTQRLDVSYLLP